MKKNTSINPIIGTLVPGTVAIYVPTIFDSNRENNTSLIFELNIC